MKRTHDSLLSSAHTLAAKFKQQYPNRQFTVEEHNEFQVNISIKDSYVQVSLGIQNYAASIQMGAESGTFTMRTAVQRLAWFFKKEQELRHRQRHARQAMRDHIKKLETAELLFENHTKIVRFDMVGFSGNRRACPAINIAFSEIPDRPFAQIIYNNYHNDKRKTAVRSSTYSVNSAIAGMRARSLARCLPCSTTLAYCVIWTTAAWPTTCSCSRWTRTTPTNIAKVAP